MIITQPSRGKKIRRTLLITVTVLSSLVGAISAKPVHAQWIVNDPANLSQQVKTTVETARKEALGRIALIALDEAASSFINRLAQQTGQFLATGGKGKTSLLRRQTLGTFARQAGESAIGDFVQDFSNESGLTKLGLNLCNPTAQL